MQPWSTSEPALLVLLKINIQHLQGWSNFQQPAALAWADRAAAQAQPLALRWVGIVDLTERTADPGDHVAPVRESMIPLSMQSTGKFTLFGTPFIAH